MPRASVNLPPPHSTEAEQSVLGALLINGDSIINVADVLKPADFYEPTHREIFAAMLALYEGRHPIDLLTVGPAMDRLFVSATFDDFLQSQAPLHERLFRDHRGWKIALVPDKYLRPKVSPLQGARMPVPECVPC